MTNTTHDARCDFIQLSTREPDTDGTPAPIWIEASTIWAFRDVLNDYGAKSEVYAGNRR